MLAKSTEFWSITSYAERKVGSTLRDLGDRQRWTCPQGLTLGRYIFMLCCLLIAYSPFYCAKNNPSSGVQLTF